MKADDITDFAEHARNYVQVGTPVKIGEVDDPEIKDLLYNFESIGFNCEFGLVQRRYAAEPLSLLRWTTTRPDVLTRLLAHRFEGVGAPDQTELRLAPWDEIILFDAKYDFVMHTFTHESGVDREIFLKDQCRRLQYLSNKLVRDLADGDKIFVYHAAEIPNPGEIHRLLRGYGASALMLARLADEAHAGGTVVNAGDGLFEVYMPRFGSFHDGNGGSYWNIDYASWIQACRTVLALQTRALPG